MLTEKQFGGLTARRLARLTQVAQNRQSGLILVLEDIHDPHNAAAMLRTADGLGIQEVYFIFDQEKRYNPRRIGKVSSSSANKWMTIRIFTSSKECFAELKKQKYQICATILDKNAQDVTTVDLSGKKIALVVGNEHRGISEIAKKMASQLLYLPMQGFVESFNVSVGAALFLYEILRQRKAKDSQGYLLSKKEAAALLADFKKR